MSTGLTGKAKIYFQSVSGFWKENDQKILTFLAIILVALVSFQAGVSHQKEKEVAQINVNLNQKLANNPQEEKLQAIAGAMDRQGVDVEKLAANMSSVGSSKEVDAIKEAVVAGEAIDGQKQDCAFVGSKNSDKYHLPNCRYAANIKPENKVCFLSKEDAEARGYAAAGCCIK